MRVSSPSSDRKPPSAAPVLAISGTVALVIAIVILVSGGVSFDAGPLHVSAHRWLAALSASIVFWAAAAVLARGDFARVASAPGAALVEHTTAIAVVLAASAAGVGVAYGTHAASASDASGYVNQANSIAQGSLVIDEPLVRSFDWPDATAAFAPLGYRAGTRRGELVPTYPPGLSIVMAAAQRIAGGTAVFFVVPLFGAAAVAATYLLGVRLHSREAGLAAALLLTTSPIFLFQLVQPMSDVPVTCLWTVALLLPGGSSARASAAAGGAAGLAVMTRPNLALLAAVIPLVAPVLFRTRVAVTSHGSLAGRRRHLLYYAGGLLVPVLALLLIQWRLYGSPFASGYGPLRELFALAAVAPNLAGYAARIWRGELPALLIGVASLAVISALRTRTRSGVPPLPLTAPVCAAAAVGLPVLLCYLPFAAFSEWSYLRFLLPALPALLVLVGAVATAAAHRLPSPAGVVGLLAALTLAASFNVRVAGREQAFRMRDYEARYRLAGRYLESALPSNTVVVAVQESGSARYYTRRPVVRWDQLSTDLDSALADLTARGRRPILLVEGPEAADLRGRFPRSAVARLDWPPMATVKGATIDVSVFDPAARNAGSGMPHDVVD